MSNLEEEIKILRERLETLTARVRLTATAERFLAGNHEIRGGDCVRLDDGFATNVYDINEHDGKWLYRDRRGHQIEAFRVPPEDGIERLYTIAEVAEIVGLQTTATSPTPLQCNEQESIERFKRDVTEAARAGRRGGGYQLDAGTTCVIMAAARAAADMAPRDENGYIDKDIAREMLSRAIVGLTVVLKEKG